MSKAEKLRAKRSGEEPETALQIAEREAKAIRAKAKTLREQRLENLGLEDLSRQAMEAAQAKIDAETGVKVVRKARTVTPANHPHMELVIAEIENPLYSRQHDGANANPRKITALVNVRESSIEYLYSRNMIDMAQKMAGGKFRMYWESAGGKGASAIDYGREHVDGGSAIDPIPDMRADAGHQLKECQRILGVRGFSIMEMVAGQGVMIADLAKARNERDAYMFMLKDGLDLLATLWGYKVQAPSARR